MAKTNAQIFQECLDTFHISASLSPGQTEQFLYYLETLLRWNRVINLTGFSTARDIVEGLLLEAFPLRSFLEELDLPRDVRIHDLGAGAGLPGIPLRILWDQGSYTMIEIREKRALFLAQLLAHMPLRQTTVHRGDFDVYFSRNACTSDLILSKACLPVERLFQAADRYLTDSGILLCFSHAQPPEQVENWHRIAGRPYVLRAREHWLGAFRRA